MKRKLFAKASEFGYFLFDNFSFVAGKEFGFEDFKISNNFVFDGVVEKLANNLDFGKLRHSDIMSGRRG